MHQAPRAFTRTPEVGGQWTGRSAVKATEQTVQGQRESLALELGFLPNKLCRLQPLGKKATESATWSWAPLPSSLIGIRSSLTPCFKGPERHPSPSICQFKPTGAQSVLCADGERGTERGQAEHLSVVWGSLPAALPQLTEPSRKYYGCLLATAAVSSV